MSRSIWFAQLRRSYKGKLLRVDFTVDDPGTFTMPWSGFVVYNRAKGVVEDVCAENIHDYVQGEILPFPLPRRRCLASDLPICR
jgi:hypothetical protein